MRAERGAEEERQLAEEELTVDTGADLRVGEVNAAIGGVEGGAGDRSQGLDKAARVSHVTRADGQVREAGVPGNEPGYLLSLSRHTRRHGGFSLNRRLYAGHGVVLVHAEEGHVRRRHVVQAGQVERGPGLARAERLQGHERGPTLDGRGGTGRDETHGVGDEETLDDGTGGEGVVGGDRREMQGEMHGDKDALGVRDPLEEEAVAGDPARDPAIITDDEPDKEGTDGGGKAGGEGTGQVKPASGGGEVDEGVEVRPPKEGVLTREMGARVVGGVVAEVVTDMPGPVPGNHGRTNAEEVHTPRDGVDEATLGEVEAVIAVQGGARDEVLLEAQLADAHAEPPERVVVTGGTADTAATGLLKTDPFA